jgi:adenine-specific DNA-methyltransferase
MRQAIADWDLSPVLEAVLLTALMEAADRVDSTVGVQMAWLKGWSRRSHNPLELRRPDMLPGPGSASKLDALEAATTLRADLVYLDPPYNQHSYRGNYHLWETLMCWDAPEVYGVAKKRVDCKTVKSDFNSKPKIRSAVQGLIDTIDCRYLVMSFSDEGYLPRAELEPMLRTRGKVRTLAIDHPRYVGSKIGIYNPKGERVGKAGKARNTEFLYVVET